MKKRKNVKRYPKEFAPESLIAFAECHRIAMANFAVRISSTKDGVDFIFSLRLPGYLRKSFPIHRSLLYEKNRGRALCDEITSLCRVDKHARDVRKTSQFIFRLLKQGLLEVGEGRISSTPAYPLQLFSEAKKDWENKKNQPDPELALFCWHLAAYYRARVRKAFKICKNVKTDKDVELKGAYSKLSKIFHPMSIDNALSPSNWRRDLFGSLTVAEVTEKLVLYCAAQRFHNRSVQHSFAKLLKTGERLEESLSRRLVPLDEQHLDVRGWYQPPSAKRR